MPQLRCCRFTLLCYEHETINHLNKHTTAFTFTLVMNMAVEVIQYNSPNKEIGTQ